MQRAPGRVPRRARAAAARRGQAPQPGAALGVPRPGAARHPALGARRPAPQRLQAVLPAEAVQRLLQRRRPPAPHALQRPAAQDVVFVFIVFVVFVFVFDRPGPPGKSRRRKARRKGRRRLARHERAQAVDGRGHCARGPGRCRRRQRSGGRWRGRVPRTRRHRASRRPAAAPTAAAAPVRVRLCR